MKIKSLNAILVMLSDFETIIVVLTGFRCVRNMMGIAQYVVAIGIYGGACP